MEYTPAQLIASPALTGYYASTLAGAFYGLPPGTTFTPARAQARVEEWLASPARTGTLDQDLDTRPHAIVGLTSGEATGDVLARGEDGLWTNIRPNNIGVTVTADPNALRPRLTLGTGVPLAGRAVYPNAGLGAVDQRYQSAFAFTARYSTRGVRLVYPNFYSGNGDALPNYALTVRASIEYPIGTPTQRSIVFFQGKRDAVIEPGGIVVSDLAMPDLPVGAVFVVWTLAIPASGGAVPIGSILPNLHASDGHEHAASVGDKTGRTFIATAASGATALTGVVGLVSADVGLTVTGGSIQAGTTLSAVGAGTATLSLATTGALNGAQLTVTGTLAQAAENSYAPSLVLGFPKSKLPIVGIYSDATLVSDARDDAAGTHFGAIDRALATANMPPAIPLVRAGEFQSSDPLTMRYRKRLIEGCTDFIEAGGTNDFVLTAAFGGSTFNKSAKLAFWTRSAYEGMKVWTATVWPRLNPGANSTNTRLARADLHTWLRDGAPINGSATVAAVGEVGPTISRTNVYGATGQLVKAASGPVHVLTGVIDLAINVETAIDSNLWISGMEVGDGASPNAVGALAASAAVPVSLFG